MRHITLVSYLTAKEGYTFVFSGPAPECNKCRFKKVCVDKLKKGHVYRVVRVLGVKNRCPINQYVITVEVEEVTIEAAVPTRLAIEGMIINYSKIMCDMSNCINNKVCNPKYLPSNGKVKIVEVLGRLQCPKKIPLSKVRVIVV